MKKLSKRENQIMIALWNSSVPLSASALKKNLDEDVSIYTIQQVLQKLLKKDYIKVDRIVQHEKALMREYVPVISQVEYITSFVNQKTSFSITISFHKLYKLAPMSSWTTIRTSINLKSWMFNSSISNCFQLITKCT